MIETNFYCHNEHIATIPMKFRVENGDTILVDNILYQVIDAKSLSIKKYSDTVSFEQTVLVTMIF